MFRNSAKMTTKITVDKLKEVDVTNSCRICKCRGNDDLQNRVKLRPLFNGRRLTRIIANTIHIEIKDLPGLPRFVCEHCLKLLKTFSVFQVDFRRSEEDFKMALEARKHSHMDALIEFSNSIEMEKQLDNDQKNAALVTNFLKKSHKKTNKPKSTLDND
ncbi:uncharacterized protein LOC117570638 [Drosophila albomicans]|uniref:Uncharacterized protein LOC117570638 n=1 Tax=Drosophila albomicans TaxID=7291 RepID=A0A6P8X5H1_DROAB|nr:uncharacterized protein LOC117570638 [Drosophila albomicans]